MTSFGADLRHARESAGVSLSQISAESKISVRNLQALEDERFDLLPGGILARGFLRAYLSYLGLDEAVWLPRFTHAFQNSEAGRKGDGDAWLAYAEAVTGVKPSPPGTDQLRFRWLGVLILLLLAALLAFGVWRFARRRVQPAAPAPVPSALLNTAPPHPGRFPAAPPAEAVQRSQYPFTAPYCPFAELPARRTVGLVA